MTSLHEDRRRASSFGGDPERYDRVRPSYPAALVDHLLAEPAARVLDVGCGTGIASALFLARGCDVLGVEADARMAAVARRRGVPVEVAEFERWDPGERRFELVICAQAWHWIDPVRGPARAAAALVPGGRLALFWNFGTPAGPARAALDAVYHELEPDLERYSVLLGHGGDRLREAAATLGSSGPFAEPEPWRGKWSRTYTTAAWQEHLLSHSDHQTLAPGPRDELLGAIGAVIDAAGGTLEVAYETQALVARVR